MLFVTQDKYSFSLILQLDILDSSGSQWEVFEAVSWFGFFFLLSFLKFTWAVLECFSLNYVLFSKFSCVLRSSVWCWMCELQHLQKVLQGSGGLWPLGWQTPSCILDKRVHGVLSSSWCSIGKSTSLPRVWVMFVHLKRGLFLGKALLGLLPAVNAACWRIGEGFCALWQAIQIVWVVISVKCLLLELNQATPWCWGLNGKVLLQPGKWPLWSGEPGEVGLRLLPWMSSELNRTVFCWAEL